MCLPWILKRLMACVAAVLPLAGVQLVRAQADGTQARSPFVLEADILTSALNVASPLVTANGTVYVGTRFTSKTVPEDYSGKLWAISANNTSRHFTANDWIDATPVVGPDGTLYVGSWDGRLYALQDNGTSISKLWEYQTNAFIYSSAAIGPDGTIYVGAGDSNLHAVNANGTLKWKFPVPDWVDSSPAVAPNGNVIVGCWDGRVYAIGPDGQERWQFSTGASVLCSPAIAADGTIYIGSVDNFLYALNPDGSKRWEYATGADIESSPAIDANGRVYFGSNDGYFYALNSDGSLAWRTQIGASVASSPALRADGSILVGVATQAGAPTAGQLVCLNSNGTVKWRFDAADIVDSSPAIGADNRIYFTDYARRLYTLNGTSGLATSGWAKWRREVAHKARVPDPGTNAQLVNISTRSFVGIGDFITIAGTYLAGGTGKNVVARGVGPELGVAPFNVAGVLQNPRLEVYDSMGLKVFENDDWDPALETVFPQVGAYPLTSGSRSSALVAPLSPNSAFTFFVKGVNDTTGVALVELFDYQQSSGRLSNLSTRAFVSTGDSVMIPGFYIAGSSAATILIRVVGPSLLGLAPSPLAQPTITLYRDGVPLITNQGWGTAPNVPFIRDVTPLVGAPPFANGSLDCAILTTLPPGPYTVVVSGVNGTTGNAVAELFVLTGY